MCLNLKHNVAVNPVQHTGVYIAGSWSVTAEFILSGNDYRWSGGVDFHIQPDGTCYHARYKRDTGVIQVGIGAPGEFPASGTKVFYSAVSGVPAAAMDEVIRMTVSGNNSGTVRLQ